MSSALTAYRPTIDTSWTRPSRTASYSKSISYEGNSGSSRTSSFTGGLPTTPSPPAKKIMTGVSLGPSFASYSSSQSYEQGRHSLHNISTAMPPRQYDNTYQLPQPPPLQQQQQQQQYRDQATQSSNQHSAQRQYDSRPTQENNHTARQQPPTEKNNGNVIAAHLQIPESVNKSKGSLAEFAAEITCLFWFESAANLQYAEDLALDSPVDRGLAPDAIPSIGFRKWVTTIISTTQVGKNVILLALMFIYRLKKFNPSVSGKRGSEFRLLTIALMLGNKFLDDNTYTNKTWAEVSGISVGEIHIMEVEFLSNMRYDLYASESEWLEWKARLGRFGSFYENALKFSQKTENSKTETPVTPTVQGSPHKFPSPPSSHHRNSSAYMNNLSTATQNMHPTLTNPISNIPPLPRSPLRHQRVPSIESTERKRSLDYGNDLPPAKRLYPGPQSTNGQVTGILTSTSFSSSSSMSGHMPPINMSESSEMGISSTVPRLPMPRIPSMNGSVSGSLAPITMSTGRAMSTVYPNTTTAATTTSWSQPVTPMSAVPPNIYQNPIPNLGDISRTHSNYGSAHTSPTGYSTNTPVLPGLSPSYFLTHRSSPYRPVRHVNTLLIPPPSAALQNPIRNIAHDQIRYQPLSKAVTEQRTGPVPYHSHDGWHQNNILTPTTQPQQYHQHQQQFQYHS